MAIKTKLTDMRPSRERYQRSIKLLSGGLINGSSFPDGMITVYPWDNSVDEWLAAKVRKGSIKGRSILFNVLPRVCNLNGCSLDNFVSSEVLLVLMVARSILRNDAVSYTTECSSCDAAVNATIKIPSQLEKIGEKLAGWPGFDIITLPATQDVVKVRPITVGEELRVIDRPETEKAKTCSDNVGRVIAGLVDVNGGVPDSLSEAITWMNALPPEDLEYLLVEFDKAQPQLGTVIHHKCDECGNTFDYSLRLDEDFFRRPSVAGNRGAVAATVRPSVQVEGAAVGPAQSTGVPNTQAPRMARKISG